MITKYTQSQLSVPDKGVRGDCFRTALGCLLNIAPSSIPLFDGPDHLEERQTWLAKLGFGLFGMDANSNMADPFTQGVRCYHIIQGPSPRHKEIRHSVVGFEGEVVWDPHPTRAGLAGTKDLWYHLFLIKL